MTRATPVAAASVLAAIAMFLSTQALNAQQADPQTDRDGKPAGEHHVATPDRPIRQSVFRLARFLAADPNAATPAIRSFLARELAPYFGFQYMARWAAGPLHHRLDEARVGSQGEGVPSSLRAPPPLLPLAPRPPRA